MLEIRVSQCMSACQRGSASSPELSADLSRTEMSWQACRLLCVIAKVPFSPCRRNSLRKHSSTSTQETWLSLYPCMWRPRSRASGNSAQSAARLLWGTHDSKFSWRFKWLWSRSEGNDCSHARRECLKLLLFHKSALFFSWPPSHILVSIFKLFID